MLLFIYFLTEGFLPVPYLGIIKETELYFQWLTFRKGQREAFISVLKGIPGLERVSLEDAHRGVHLQAMVAGGNGNTIDAFYDGIIGLFKNQLKNVSKVAILRGWPEYDLGTRDTPEDPMAVTCEDARDLRRAEWPAGIRED